MKRLTKKTSQSMHARKRAIERFGLKYNRFVRKELVKMIQNGKAEFIEKQSNRVSKWRILYDGRWIDVIYDGRRKTIVTFLYIDEEENAKYIDKKGDKE